MEHEFNLIDEPWIIVRNKDCSLREVSLNDLFIHAHEYTELAGETKTQDMAVLRLLLAVVHTVFSRYDLNGDDTDIESNSDILFDNWAEMWKNGKFPSEPFERYFSEWHERFWLFDEKYPFYQSNAVKEHGKEYSTAKMIGSLFESGNKPRLFSDRKNEGRNLSYAESARWLLHIICFDDIAAKNPTPKQPWTGKLNLVAVKGKNIFETIMLNYNFQIDSEYGVYYSTPSWESDSNDVKFNNEIAVPDNQAGLLSLMSRRIFLCRENGYVSGYYVSGGDYFESEDVFQEQMTLWKSYEEKKGVYKFKPKKYDTSKKAWQEFGSVAVGNENTENKNTENENNEKYHSAGVLSFVKKLKEQNILKKDYMVNVVMTGVIYNYKQATSLPVLDVVSDTLTFHSQLLLDSGSAWRTRINMEIEKCEQVAKKVYLLSIDLQKSAGADGDKLTGNEEKVLFYNNIDRTFRVWLSELKPEYDSEEYTSILEKKLLRIALRTGEEMLSYTSESTIFGYVKKDTKKDKKYILSSADAFNRYAGSIRKIFELAGDENEQK